MLQAEDLSMRGSLFEGLESRTFLSAAPLGAPAQDAVDAGALTSAVVVAKAAPAANVTAALTAAPVTTAGGSSYTFTIKYNDPAKIRSASLGNGDVLVTGPKNFKAVAKLVSVNPTTDATAVTATYSIVAPAKKWAAAANGAYTVTVRAKSVSNAVGGVNAAEIKAGTFNVNVPFVNQAPSFKKGRDLVVKKDAGAQTVNKWATKIADARDNPSTQTLSFVVTTDNDTLFSAKPQISADGKLTFTAATGKTGTATVTVRLKNSGGTANGGVDTSAAQTFKITVK
jgi:hypothetical protein